VARKLQECNNEVIGFDNLINNCDPSLKKARLDLA
jgi:hypothetical protein